MTALGDAIAAHYSQQREARRQADDEQLRGFVEDPQLERVLVARDSDTGQYRALTSDLRGRAQTYERRKRAAAELAARTPSDPDPKEAA